MNKIENIVTEYFTPSNSVEVIKLYGKRGKEKILYLHNIEGDVFVIFESLTDFIFYFEENEVITCIASLDTEEEVEEFLLNYEI